MRIPFCSPLRSVAAVGTAALLLQENTNYTSTDLHKLLPGSSSSAATRVTVHRSQLSPSARPRQLSAPPAVQFHVSVPRPRRAPALRAGGHVRCPIQPEAAPRCGSPRSLVEPRAPGLRPRPSTQRGQPRPGALCYGLRDTAHGRSESGQGRDRRRPSCALAAAAGAEGRGGAGALTRRAGRYGAARGAEEAALRNAGAG